MKLSIDVDLRDKKAVWVERKCNYYEIKFDTCEAEGTLKVSTEDFEEIIKTAEEENNYIEKLEGDIEDLLMQIDLQRDKIEELENDIEEYQEINEYLRRKY